MRMPAGWNIRVTTLDSEGYLECHGFFRWSATSISLSKSHEIQPAVARRIEYDCIPPHICCARHAGQRGKLPERDFVPWRFSAAGRQSACRGSSLPAAENLHKTSREQSQQSRASLFDHLVGAGEKRRWDSKAECFCGLEIDHQLKLRRL